jgi:glycosyltransferase involved in cell wall biosynthesis
MNSCPVSVIIPTFNRSLLLKRAIDSVLRQTVQCSELIIIDDGSTDNTQDVLHSLSTFAGISFRVYQQKNTGPAAARNLGVCKSEFPFVAFLDSDDHWHKRKLEKQYRYLANSSDCQISHTREKWLRRGQHLNQKKKHIPRQGDIYDHCLQLCAVGMSTVMMKKEMFDHVGLFDESLRCCEDYDLWLRVSCKYPFLLVDEALTVKEGGRDDQVSSQYRLGMDQMRIYSLRKLLDNELLDSHRHLLALNEFKRKVRIFGNGCLKHNNADTGASYLDLIPVYEEMAVKKFPILRECINAQS